MFRDDFVQTMTIILVNINYIDNDNDTNGYIIDKKTQITKATTTTSNNNNNNNNKC